MQNLPITSPCDNDVTQLCLKNQGWGTFQVGQVKECLVNLGVPLDPALLLAAEVCHCYQLYHTRLLDVQHSMPVSETEGAAQHVTVPTALCVSSQKPHAARHRHMEFPLLHSLGIRNLSTSFASPVLV